MEPTATVPVRGQLGPLVLNALLRCTREDRKAAPLFERVEKVPGLWVLELGPFAEDSWTIWLSDAYQTLTRNEALLRSLGPDSNDYTLHITVRFSDGLLAATIPPSMSQILASCGIALEIYSEGT
jgi:hypothetical protein